MTWIKDINGDILNAYHYRKIGCEERPLIAKFCVFAILKKETGGRWDDLFQGTEEECKEYMDKMMRDLNGIGKDYFIPSGSKVQTPYILMERDK